MALLDVSADVPLAEKMPANVRAYIDEIVARSPRFELYARALRSADDAVRAIAVAAREQIAAGIARNHLGTSRAAQAGARGRRRLRRVRRGDGRAVARARAR